MSVTLKVVGLKKSYKKVQVLNGMNFHVAESETFGLLGGNGAGKSTTLECIEGIKTFDSGKIEIDGKDIKKHKDLHKILGVQLQCSSLQNNITVYESMVFYCKWHGIDTRTDLLSRFGLDELYNKQYDQLSIGQRRRLHLALSICHDPKILILDEPTAGLDVQGRNELHDEIRLLKSAGVTIILASHDMAEVEMLCDRIAIVVKGEIKYIGRADELSAGSKGKRIKVKTTKGEVLNKNSFKYSEVESRSSSIITLKSDDIENAIKEIMETVEQKQDIIEDLNIEGLSLEEKFIEIISKNSEVKNESADL